MKKILPLFSYIFHPLFISLYAAVFYFWSFQDFYNATEIYVALIQVTILTLLIPISLFYLLITLGKVDSFMIPNMQQRRIPLLVNCILLYLLTEKSITLDRAPELFYFYFGALLSTLLAFIGLLLKKKISLHMIGISALSVFLFFLSLLSQNLGIEIVAFFLASIGFVASSRLSMRAHSISELIWGFLAGVLPQIALFYWQL